MESVIPELPLIRLLGQITARLEEVNMKVFETHVNGEDTCLAPKQRFLVIRVFSTFPFPGWALPASQIGPNWSKFGPDWTSCYW